MRRAARNLAEFRRAARRGRLAETLCRWHLRLRGWRILARDWRSPVGEIDIIARRGGTIAVIEVKARRDLETAVFAINPRQRRRIARTAEAFLASRPDLAHLSVRFDVMLVERRRLPHHLPGAWRGDE